MWAVRRGVAVPLALPRGGLSLASHDKPGEQGTQY